MLSKLVWTKEAWADYLYWQTQDKKTLKRINTLLKETLRAPASGMGKPENLCENLSGLCSRRIDQTNRIVYKIENDRLIVIACRYHYF